MLTSERLKQLLHYDPETGHFIRMVDAGRIYRAGSRAGSLDERGYRRIRIDGSLYREHRLAHLYMTGDWPAEQIDHINLDTTDNRWVNLRVATETQNKGNTGLRRDNTSGIKGVSWRKQERKWLATIYVDGRQKRLGLFSDKADAATAYSAAARQHFGEFSRPIQT